MLGSQYFELEFVVKVPRAGGGSLDNFEADNVVLYTQKITCQKTICSHLTTYFLLIHNQFT